MNDSPTSLINPPVKVNPDICPKCGLSHKALREMLKQPHWHEDFAQATNALENCKACRSVFCKEMK